MSWVLLPLWLAGYLCLACARLICGSTTHTFNMLFLFAGRVGLSKALMMENKLESERNNL